MSLINREALIAEYDRVHIGQPGGARKLMVDAPEVKPEPKWISVNENQPEKYGWYLCSLKDGRVNTLYWHNRKGWIDDVRMYMFELYDIRSKLTGNEVKPENESVYWNDWVKAWMPLPTAYREDGGE